MEEVQYMGIFLVVVDSEPLSLTKDFKLYKKTAIEALHHLLTLNLSSFIILRQQVALCSHDLYSVISNCGHK